MKRIKKTIASALVPALALAADPELSNVAISGGGPGRLVVSYSLANGPAVVTATFSVGGEEAPARAAWYMTGDVNTVVAGPDGEFTWDYGHVYTNLSGDVTASLSAWPLDAPPLYCAVDLAPGTNAASYRLEFYTSGDAVPGGVGDAAYKTRKILLRKIPATGDGGFVMGSPEGEEGRDAAREAQHTVVLTHDFYMGVYEITQEQYWSVKGTNCFYYSANERAGWPYVPERPADYMTYGAIRGSRAEGIDWPNTGSAVAPGSFLGLLRARTGNLVAFDLPTDAQWEYACRAGTSGARYSGADVATLARCGQQKASSGEGGKTAAQGGTQRVGEFTPNGWGLYDMYGNVMEWCCDWRLADTSSLPAVNPVGPAAFTDAANVHYRIARGGNCVSAGETNLRSAHRNSWSDDKGYAAWGFRLSATLGATWDMTTTPPALK